MVPAQQGLEATHPIDRQIEDRLIPDLQFLPRDRLTQV